MEFQITNAFFYNRRKFFALHAFFCLQQNTFENDFLMKQSHARITHTDSKKVVSLL